MANTYLTRTQVAGNRQILYYKVHFLVGSKYATVSVMTQSLAGAFR